MNHTDVVENCVTERAIAATLRTSSSSVAVPDRGALPLDDDGRSRTIPEGSWRETVDNGAVPDPDSPRMLCLALSWNRSRCYIARAA